MFFPSIFHVYSHDIHCVLHGVFWYFLERKNPRITRTVSTKMRPRQSPWSSTRVFRRPASGSRTRADSDLLLFDSRCFKDISCYIVMFYLSPWNQRTIKNKNKKKRVGCRRKRNLDRTKRAVMTAVPHTNTECSINKNTSDKSITYRAGWLYGINNRPLNCLQNTLCR